MAENTIIRLTKDKSPSGRVGVTISKRLAGGKRSEEKQAIYGYNIHRKKKKKEVLLLHCYVAGDLPYSMKYHVYIQSPGLQVTQFKGQTFHVSAANDLHHLW